MGQGLSCRSSEEQGLFSAVQLGDLETVEAVLQRDSTLVHRSTVYDRNSNGCGSRWVSRFYLDTPLMLAAMHGKISCVRKLIEAGANASETDLCCICFDQICTIEVQECGHRMCAQCTLALCCHNKPNPTTASPSIPICPFCRSDIIKLVVAKPKTENDRDRDINSTKPRKSWRSRNLSEGSSSFKGLSAVGSFRRMGRGSVSGRILAENEWLDKPLSLDT
ncbi:UNVERIFIED_CONTAM: E3 ubiquitin-protein ligase XB3 [Sesamum radiatum]|uniref:RING-type E3 ubiquitin transferase n=1 Tax=Sesamum radiatum TaxID=300843 RepID=A0AAW2W5P2_SESRA